MLAPLLALMAGMASAQDGEQLYHTYCSACHAPDGMGATGGQFPPLAGSPWLSGKPDRAIKIVLHGLQGPVDVADKRYDLVMPPQGVVLPDDQIAAILTHVRSAWGNRAGKVTSDQVGTIRAENAKRTRMWTQKELLELHPLPRKTPALRNLTSRVYHGKWKKLPDFSKLEARNVEEEHDGIIRVSQADRTDHFGMVWEGEFMAPKSGDYLLRLACDDGGRILLDGEVILEVHGLGPMSRGRTQAAKLKLDAGAHPIRVEYFEYAGGEGIAISWKGPGDRGWRELTDNPLAKAAAKPTIPINPTAGRAAIYRNFIAGTTPRAIGVGLPSGINIAYSADHLAPELLWTGKFMDGGRHWTNRGAGAEPPAGEEIVKATGSPAFPDNAQFKGYRLDPRGNPTFTVEVGGLQVHDQFKASDRRLVRSLSAVGHGDPVEILIADQMPLKAVGEQTYELGPATFLKLEDATVTTRDGRSYLKLSAGESCTLNYLWK